MRSMRRWMPLAMSLLLAGAILFADSNDAFEKARDNPKGVVDLFLTCSFIGFVDGTEATSYGAFYHSDSGELGVPPDVAYEKKVSLLDGNGHKDIARNLKVIDEKNGYMRLIQADTNLTFVFYKYPDGSYVPAFRLKIIFDYGPESPPCSKVQWGFYNVQNGKWINIDCDDLPDGNALFSKDFLQKFLGRGPVKEDLDNIHTPKYTSVRFWDISLPQFGTTAHLIPLNFRAAGEGDPSVSFGGGGFEGLPIAGEADYARWFADNFSYDDGSRKALELKWNKANRNFMVGEVLHWDMKRSRPLGASD